jgi:hypothetical protein
MSFRLADAPMCATDKMMIVGASKGEQVQLTCEISSYPLPRKYFWKFENSEETVEIDQKKFSQEGNKSVLSFSTLSDHVIHIFFIINCNEFF